MSWKDVYNQPSFRGVPFHVDGTDESGGRRLATHEYPQRDIPYHEDLGKSAQDISFDAYVSGTNYHLDRDALKRALNEPGPGELVHPYHGVVQVHVRSYTLREASTEGGVARFSITFAVAGEARYPTSRANVTAGVNSRTAILRDQSRQAFIDRFTTTGFPGFICTSAENLLRGATNVVEAAFTAVTGDSVAGADYIIRLAQIRNNLAALVDAPGDLADELRGLFAAASLIVSGPRAASRAHRQVYDNTSKVTLTGTTPTRVQESANLNALNEFTRSLALAEAAEQAVRTVYTTFDEAVDTQQQTVDRMDTEAELVTDDEVFLAIEEARAALAAAVPDPAAALPQLVTYTPISAEPSLVAAYRLYADAARGDEITARNMIRHPMFLPGGQSLLVIADG